MSRAHSSLPPSAAKMWIACNPSAKKNAEAPEQTSSYAQEGTDAHTVCEEGLKRSLGIETEDSRENLEYYDQEMQDHADEYVAFVNEILSRMEAPYVMIEQRLDLSEYAPGCFGTGDCVAIGGHELQIVDFKYGKGIPVSAGSDEKGLNPQLACYALGAVSAFDMLYDIETVSMSIFQPRLNIAETYTVTKDALVSWGKNVLSPAANRAIKGEGEFVAGDHCTFCKFKAQCRKRAEYNLELAKYDFEKPENLDDSEIEEILGRVDDLVTWASDIKAFALSEALSGKVWTDYKLVEGRSVRKYTNESMVVQAVKNAGYDPYEKVVLGITAMTRMLGKKKFNELLGDLVEKPAGRPTLAPLSDKRPAVRITATDDFKEE